jgi:hypothetical protein
MASLRELIIYLNEPIRLANGLRGKNRDDGEMRKERKERKSDPESQTWWKELKAHKKGNWCCRLFMEAGVEWVQCETWDLRFHKLKLNYCMHCGRKL